MRMPVRSPAVLASLCLAVLACGHGKQTGQCEHNFDCAAGEGCVSGSCKALACGGCQADEACSADGNCVLAQGASCGDHTCPATYLCSAGGVCAKKCVVSDSECDPGFFCLNKSCVECSNDGQCAAKDAGKVKPICDTAAGTCVACKINFDCVKALGTGHYCDAHACKPGCKLNTDCNAGLNETCDTSTNPGKCIQCKTSSDCAAQGPSASACDDTGHCVQCWGATQAEASLAFCGSGTRECNLATRTCVQCLPSNNASGADCGYQGTNPPDSHDARTCNPATYSCAPGCEVDAQCGCPGTEAGGAESDCVAPDGTTHRKADLEHCDKNRTTMAGVTGATLGACVQCTDNTHCEYKISGNTSVSGHPGTLNGSRCVNDSCIEGCDTDKDCWPDHTYSNGKICHLGHTSTEPLKDLDHKCVQCHCNVLSVDGTYCEDDPVCTNAGKVCDKETLSCRLKRQGEQCDSNADCGATAPSSACFPLGSVGGVSGTGFCVLSRNADINNPTLYCSASHSAPGRCGDFCDEICACQPGSGCFAAASMNGPGKACVPDSCNNH